MPQPRRQTQNNDVSIRKIAEQEFITCAVDQIYFFKKYALIEHPMKGRINFNLYPFQEDVLRQLKDYRFNIINKSRQMGITTLMAGDSLHNMLFTDGFKIVVIATTQETARLIVDKVQLMYEFLPDFLKQGIEIVNNNKLSFSLSNGSSIIAKSSSPTAARGLAASRLILDEFAHADGADEIWEAAQATLSTGGSCVIMSTPFGIGNAFHQIWQQAVEGRTGEGNQVFNPINLPWNLHPDRDDRWFELQVAQLGKRKAAQEFCCDFESSGHTIIDSEDLAWYVANSVQDPIEKRGLGGDIWVWRYPDYTNSYCLVCDVARGDGEDYSAFHIFEVENMDQVVEFKGKVDTQTLGHMIVALATEYNNALLVIDNKNIGWSTVQVALDRKYDNLYYSYKHDPYLDESVHLTKGYDLKNKEDMVPGFTIGTKIRPVMISKLEQYVREREVKIRSKRTVNEFQVFIWTQGKAQAQKGYSDDLTMALSMFFYVRDTALRLRQMGIELIRTTLRSVHKPIYKANRLGADKWEMQVNGKSESIKWLVGR